MENCEEHKNEICNFFCFDCNKKICEECNFDHISLNHKSYTLKMILKKFYDKIEKNLNDYDQFSKKYLENIQKIEENLTYYDTFEKEFDELIKNLIAHLEKVKKNKIQEKSEILENVILPAKNNLKEIEITMEKMKNEKVVVENLEKENKYLEIINKINEKCENPLVIYGNNSKVVEDQANNNYINEKFFCKSIILNEFEKFMNFDKEKSQQLTEMQIFYEKNLLEKKKIVKELNDTNKELEIVKKEKDGIQKILNDKKYDYIKKNIKIYKTILSDYFPLKLFFTKISLTFFPDFEYIKYSNDNKTVENVENSTRCVLCIPKITKTCTWKIKFKKGNCSCASIGIINNYTSLNELKNINGTRLEFKNNNYYAFFIVDKTLKNLTEKQEN